MNLSPDSRSMFSASAHSIRTVVVLSALVLTLGFPVTLPAQQNTGEVEIGVRSQVEPGVLPNQQRELVAQGGRKLYAMLQVQQRGSSEKLARPVDAETIALEVARQLDRRGYERARPKQKPDIVITAEYGRDVLPNPYLGEVTTNYGTIVRLSTQPVPINRTGQKSVGLEERTQRAGFEKLFIEVKAWKYPENPQEKPRVMWVSTMHVDDPDHRDLNTIFKDMLAAGAPYFDRVMEEPEVSVFKPLPEGNVKVGTPTVVEPTKPNGK